MYGSSKLTHFCFVSTHMNGALMTPAARSHSLRDKTPVSVRRMLGCDLTSSGPRIRRAHVIHTPFTSTSSTMSCKRRSSLAMSNDGCMARNCGSGGLGTSQPQKPGNDSVAVHRWMWMTGKAACEGDRDRVDTVEHGANRVHDLL